MNCEGELTSNYPSDVQSLVAHEFSKAEAEKNAAYYEIINTMKPRQIACNCGNGVVESEWEECDPGEKSKGYFCTADCKFLTLPKNLNALKNIGTNVSPKAIKLFPDLVDQ